MFAMGERRASISREGNIMVWSVGDLTGAVRRLLLSGQYGKRHRVYGVGIVAEADVKGFSFRRRNCQRILNKAFGDGDRVGEIWIGADRVEQEKFVAAE